jgi:uncharacterized membrane protein YkoI
MKIMKPTKKHIAAALITAGLAGAAFAAQAKEVQLNDAVAASGANLTLNGALNLALQEVPGTAVSAKFEDRNGQSVWAIEILASNQEVRNLLIDSTTGNVLQNSTDHLDRYDRDNVDQDD